MLQEQLPIGNGCSYTILYHLRRLKKLISLHTGLFHASQLQFLGTFPGAISSLRQQPKGMNTKRKEEQRAESLPSKISCVITLKFQSKMSENTSDIGQGRKFVCEVLENSLNSHFSSSLPPLLFNTHHECQNINTYVTWIFYLFFFDKVVVNKNYQPQATMKLCR